MPGRSLSDGLGFPRPLGGVKTRPGVWKLIVKASPQNQERQAHFCARNLGAATKRGAPDQNQALGDVPWGLDAARMLEEGSSIAAQVRYGAQDHG